MKDSIRKTKIIVGIASRLKSWHDLTSIEMHLSSLSRFFLSRVAKILRIIADSETPKSIKEISKAIEEGKVTVSGKNIAKYLLRLVEKNLIRRTKRGFYIISDQMFRGFICSSLN